MVELTKALVKFHMEVGKIKKDASNPFFNSKYASLSNILDVITPVLVTCDLNIMQMPVGEGKLKTILSHTSGESVESEFDMHIVKRDPQAMGSAITYARRYALGSILNLNIEDDDDANSAKPSADYKQDSYKAPTAPRKDTTDSGGEKEWLNATDKSGMITDLGKQVAFAIIDGKRTWDDLYLKYKISKKDKSAIEAHIESLSKPKINFIETDSVEDEMLPF